MVEILPGNVAFVALGTLAAGVAVIVDDVVMTDAFLAKHYRAQFALTASDAGDAIIVGIAQGDATVAEIKSALEQKQLKRDTTLQDTARKVLFETTQLITVGDISQEGVTHMIDVSLGGGKGIPFKEDDGYAVFAYNAAPDAFSTGALLIGHFHLTGVWL